MNKGIEDRMTRARAGDPAAYEGQWEVDDRAPFADREPEVLVSRSLRVSVATYEQVRKIAAVQGRSPSALMRQWIEDGVAVAQDEPSRSADPVSLVTRLQADLARLARALHMGAPA